MAFAGGFDVTARSSTQEHSTFLSLSRNLFVIYVSRNICVIQNKSDTLYVTRKVINIFVVCASDMCAVFALVVFGTLKASVACLWIILFPRTSFKAEFIFLSAYFSFWCFGISDIFLREKV